MALGVVSLLTDASSEMIYPLLPLFLGGTLGAGPAVLGAIEGAAETTASLLKLASGWWSDHLTRRRPLVVTGYTLSSVARPLVALATGAGQVLAVRLADRVGKGVRSSPRDALIADAASPEGRGRAFGFQRAMDHAGAVIGPLVAWGLMADGWSLREVFAWAALPGAFAVAALVVGVRESPREAPPVNLQEPAQASRDDQPLASAPDPWPRQFPRYLAVLVLFTLGNSSDAFLLLRAADLGVPAAHVPLLWAAHHAVKAALGTWGGGLSDRIGRRRTILAGWGWYALVYAGFALASTPWHAWGLFGAYALVFALVEGAEKAYVADLVPAPRRGAAFGWFNAAVGLAALPASLLFGLVWQRWGATAAFATGAAFAAAAMAGLALGAAPSAAAHRR